MRLTKYLESLKGRTVTVIGIGVSNTPLIEMLCKSGNRVVACDRKSREALGETAEHLEDLGAELKLGSDYLKCLEPGVIFRTPGMRPDLP